MTPQRIQLRRTKGWRLPSGAMSVARPTRWGNPFTLAGAREAGYEGSDRQLRAMCVAMYRDWLSDPQATWSHGADRAEWIAGNLGLLVGHDLACWCPLDAPCHAAVLLEWCTP